MWPRLNKLFKWQTHNLEYQMTSVLGDVRPVATGRILLVVQNSYRYLFITFLFSQIATRTPNRIGAVNIKLWSVTGGCGLGFISKLPREGTCCNNEIEQSARTSRRPRTHTSCLKCVITSNERAVGWVGWTERDDWVITRCRRTL